MKLRIYFVCASLVFVLTANSVYSQTKKPASKSKATTAKKKKVPVAKTNSDSLPTLLQADAIRVQAAVIDVLLRSGISFKEGLVAYEDNRRSDAGDRFNKSVEVFLYSTLSIQREPTLQNCYNHLVETIYRIEFPLDNQLPQIRNLSQTCNWNIHKALADKITAITKTANQGKPGFNSQEFKPSPLDQLSGIELTAEEQHVDTSPVGNPTKATSNSRPTNSGASVVANGVRVVKAKAGDTLQKVAERYNADPIEVAKYNGLLPNSTLGAGRPIKIPNK